MTGTPMIIGPKEKARLANLRKYATDNPIDIPPVMEQIKTPEGLLAHEKRMDRYSCWIPLGFRVVFSIETGHPVGTSRHLSVSSPAKGRIPNIFAMGMLAEELGFVGGLELCGIWDEDIGEGQKAINLIQPLSVTPPAQAV